MPLEKFQRDCVAVSVLYQDDMFSSISHSLEMEVMTDYIRVISNKCSIWCLQEMKQRNDCRKDIEISEYATAIMCLEFFHCEYLVRVMSHVYVTANIRLLLLCSVNVMIGYCGYHFHIHTTTTTMLIVQYPLQFSGAPSRSISNPCSAL